MRNDIDRIREALQFIDASDRETWLRMGMAIKSELADTGFDVWEAWSQQAESFNGKDARDVWKSIRAGGKVTIGTLFYEAKANGWHDDGMHQKPTPEEIAERKRIAAERAAQEEAEIARERADTAKKAAAILKAATEAKTDNPYLLRKRVSPVATLREIDAGKAAAILGYQPRSRDEPLAGRLLVVPVKQGDSISTLELIDGDKRKAALAGRGSKAGGYWATQRLPDGDGAGLTLLIGEGVATVLSAKEASGHPALAALSSGNLPAVAKAMRERYPAAALVILADLVKATGEPDPHAIEAAKVGAGRTAIPDFGADRDPDATDFNDMAAICGLEAVASAIASASEPARGEHQPGDDDAPAGNSASPEWPEPLPIPDGLLPVERFDAALLPASFRPWISDIAERMQCPIDFPAVGAMVAISSVIGRKACIYPKRHDDWHVIPNLWGAIVGRPGVMKSPALAEAIKPLDRLAVKANELHAEAMRDHKLKERLNELADKADEKKAQDLVRKGKHAEAEQLLAASMDNESNPAPALRRYKVTDASVEALGEVLMENPFGTLAYRDELNGLLRSLDKEGQEGARAFYLQGYDGNQGYTFDRIMRGRNLHIPAVCISMLGGIQPGKLQAYIRDAVSGGAGDDGLLQRFGLLVWPDVAGEWRNVDRWPDTEAKRQAFAVFEKLDAMQPGTDAETGEPAPVAYRFTPEAQGIFDDWRHELEIGLRSGEHHPAVESHLSKYRKLAPALALVCALTDDESEVGRNSLLRALAWLDYLRSHASRAYAAGTRPATDGAKALLAKIKSGAVPDGFKPADVYLKGWAHLGNPEETHAAINMLCDLGHLRRVEILPGVRGGRPSITYQINPASMGRA